MRYVAEAFRTSDVELVSHFTSKPGRAGDRGACPLDVGPPLAPHVSLLVLPLVTPLVSCRHAYPRLVPPRGFLLVFMFSSIGGKRN